ncbi:N-terminal domain of NEFA-interacting nuclear protein NIP30-domain-containing protein [Elsinoe ampelina]|uniref:N-terminal domain of NEFA-interacting nuclear protein NIP30-domain-containing protein n=1 Tax=Elsinoe ampelina TaxID=302913 RepID=A0A6A6G655_9PEZI|nr:N-terminal domain of NEFA-interacting nuclear protein NIP30-domain-containing protein [Elsinoe ampelina]
MSRFVPGGTVDKPTERSGEWLKAQQAIEAKKLAKIEQNRQQDGKSLYEKLEENKAAKQDAFEESIRLRNQFRALDEDEIDFLESLDASTKSKEVAVRKETSELLSNFRNQQLKAESEARTTTEDQPSVVAQKSWTVKGKRKRDRTTTIAGLKARKTSTIVAADTATANMVTGARKDMEHTNLRESEPPWGAEPPSKQEDVSLMIETSYQRLEPEAVALGLTAYHSDEEAD